MKWIPAVLALALMVSCGDIISTEYIPTTPEERVKIQTTVDSQLSKAFPNGLSLSGHDQDWDDFVQRVNIEVRYNTCRPTQWQYRDGEKTGTWRYLGESEWRREAIR